MEESSFWFINNFVFVESAYFIPGADPGIYFGGQTKVPNRKLNAKPESRARSARVYIEGKARVEGAKRPRIEDEARTEGQTREKAGGGVWGGGLGDPPPIK